MEITCLAFRSLCCGGFGWLCTWKMAFAGTVALCVVHLNWADVKLGQWIGSTSVSARRQRQYLITNHLPAKRNVLVYVCRCLIYRVLEYSFENMLVYNAVGPHKFTNNISKNMQEGLELGTLKFITYWETFRGVGCVNLCRACSWMLVCLNCWLLVGVVWITALSLELTWHPFTYSWNAFLCDSKHSNTASVWKAWWELHNLSIKLLWLSVCWDGT